MLIYKNTARGFLQDVVQNRIVDQILAGFEAQRIGGVARNEIRAWRHSLQYMANLFFEQELPDDAEVAIEFQIPLTSRRVDFMIAGRDAAGERTLVVIELKQWGGERTEPVPHKDGIVTTVLGGGLRETTHPSYQAWSYTQLIKDFNVAVQRENIRVHPLAYLHNFDAKYRDRIDNEIYRPYTERAPVFLKQDVDELSEYLASKITTPDTGDLLQQVEDADLKPNKKLQDSLEGMLEANDEFTLIDSQKVVFERAVELAKQANEEDEKKVLIVEGGPGTGKTVVAVNILAELIQNEYTTQYVSKNRAPRAVYKQKLRGDMLVKEIDHLFTGAGSYVSTPPNQYPALVADEAHRLNEESTFFGRGENQVMEIINAAKFSVFFIDESQRVHIDDIGTKQEIHKFATEMNADIETMELDAQFRCSGSDGYVAWLDDVLAIRETANADGFDLQFDVRLYDDPQRLHETIEARNTEGQLSRVVAGYCWEWDKDGRSDPAYHDIEIGEYRRSWNLDGGDPWAVDEGSIDEVGCIHTCQGLEFDYVGVIIGPDLKYRDGEIITDHEARATTDRSLFGIKKMLDEDPERAREIIDEVIKNTYRTLLSRGLKGCYIYCCDDQLRAYMRKRLSNINGTIDY
ncbi:DUF2075 domain-containing protein [Halalkalirubrum salinum]|uniref:DUF2075 domain-containing protein n=1 Tax=Halalkalirubrum salinum TaxID=2563889 RepID=UPI0010FAE48F|nr:DUF2075 domain-containing protein [Halalkalirubrum salinum]